MLITIQVYGSADLLGPCAQQVPGVGLAVGLATGAGGQVAADVGAACPVLQRAKCLQPETGSVEFQTVLPEEVNSP